MSDQNRENPDPLMTIETEGRLRFHNGKLQRWEWSQVKSKWGWWDVRGQEPDRSEEQ